MGAREVRSFLNDFLLCLLYCVALQVDDNYVARRKSATHGEHHHHGVDYHVGRYAPKQSLGKVIVNVENSEKVLTPIRTFAPPHESISATLIVKMFPFSALISSRSTGI